MPIEADFALGAIPGGAGGVASVGDVLDSDEHEQGLVADGEGAVGSDVEAGIIRGSESIDVCQVEDTSSLEA